MSASRTPKPRTKIKPTAPWTPEKHKREVSAMLAEPIIDDPWLDYRAFRKRTPPPSSDVLAFWEWELRRQHWEYVFPAAVDRYDRDVPRTLWKQIQTCEPLKRLASGPVPPEHLHAVMLLLNDLHRRELGCAAAPHDTPAMTRKDERRYWEKQARSLARAHGILQDTHESLIPSDERERLCKAVHVAAEQAATFAKTGAPRTLTILRFGGTPNSPPVTIPPTPPRKGQRRDTGSDAFLLKLECAALVEFLPPTPTRKTQGRPWAMLLALLRHFHPRAAQRNYHALRSGLEHFAQENRAALDTFKTHTLASARHIVTSAADAFRRR